MNAEKGEKFPAAFQISRQLDQEKIAFLTDRISDLVKSNNKLRASSGQNEKDTHDIVLYFQREMEIKDDIILRLNEELVKCQTQLKFEVEKVRRQFEQEIYELKENSDNIIHGLTMRLNTAEADLKAVELFRREKDQHEQNVQKLERALQMQREQMVDAMEEQERRSLEEKSQLFKDLDDQKAAFREIALNEAKSAMGQEAKKILADNHRMFEELKFHHNEAADNAAEKKLLQNELQKAKREVAIFLEKEIEYAKQAHNRSKEIKTLRDRVSQLENMNSVNIEKFKQKAKELRIGVTKELEEATLDAAGLRRLLQLKNQELKHMKALATTILSQRTETEQFFLESLQEVKDVIKKERRLSQFEKKKMQNKLLGGAGVTGGANSGTFPPLSIKANQIHLLESQKHKLQLSDLEKVTIKDLSWDDKELVLRVLFAKMNGSQGKERKQPMIDPSLLTGQMPAPVFVSEGSNFPDINAATDYQSNFVIPDTPGGLLKSEGTDYFPDGGLDNFPNRPSVNFDDVSDGGNVPGDHSFSGVSSFNSA